jgi:hypothetical protein
MRLPRGVCPERKRDSSPSAQNDRMRRAGSDRREWGKIELSPFFNNILTFECYTSSSRREKDRLTRIQGIGLIDKGWGENL